MGGRLAVLNEMTSGFQAKMEELRSINDNLDREVRTHRGGHQNERLTGVGFLRRVSRMRSIIPSPPLHGVPSRFSRELQSLVPQGHDDFDPEDTRSTLAVTCR